MIIWKKQKAFMISKGKKGEIILFFKVSLQSFYTTFTFPLLLRMAEKIFIYENQKNNNVARKLKNFSHKKFRFSRWKNYNSCHSTSRVRIQHTTHRGLSPINWLFFQIKPQTLVRIPQRVLFTFLYSKAANL